MGKHKSGEYWLEKLLKNDLLIAVSVSVAFAIVYSKINYRILPLVDSIIYPLGQPGMLPYRDYFFPVTPGTYFMTQLAVSMPGEDVLLAYRTIGLLGLPVIVMPIYYLSRIFSGRIVSILMSGVAVGSFFELGLEMLGGWNLLSIAFSTAGVSMVAIALNMPKVKYFDSFGLRIPKHWLLLFFSGLSFGISVLIKQTHAIELAFQLAIWGLLVTASWGTSRAKLIFNWRNSAPVITGLFVSITPFVIWLSTNSLSQDFINNMFSLGGKVPTVSKVMQDAMAGILTEMTSISAILFLSIGALIATSKRLIPETLANMVYVLLCSSFAYSVFWQESRQIFSTTLLMATVAMAIVLVCFRYIFAKRFLKNVFVSSWAVFFASQSLFIILSSASIPGGLSMLNMSSKLFVGLTVTISVLVSIVILLNLGSKVSRRFEMESIVEFTGASRKSGILLLAVAGTFSAILNVASGGSQAIYFVWLMPSFIILIQFFANYVSENSDYKFSAIPYLVVCVSVFASFAYGYLAPYSWWGWREPSLGVATASSSLTTYQRLVPARSVDEFYRELMKLELKAAELTGKESPTILSIGNIPMATSISGLNPYSLHYCRIQWFDLCPNDLLLDDLRVIQETPPDIIVFEDISEGAFIAHESAFLRQPSALRKYNDYRYEQVRLGNWVEVGEVKTIGDPIDKTGEISNWDLHVYAVVSNVSK